MYHIEKLPLLFKQDLKMCAQQILSSLDEVTVFVTYEKDLSDHHKKIAARAMIRSHNDEIMKSFSQMQYNLIKPAMSSTFNPINIDIDLQNSRVRFSKIYHDKLQAVTIPLYDYIIFCRLMYGTEMVKKVGITIAQKPIMKPLTSIGDLTTFINKHTYEARHQLARYLVAHSRAGELSAVERSKMNKLFEQYKEIRIQVGSQPRVSSLHSRYLDNVWARSVFYTMLDRAFLFEADSVRCTFDGEFDHVVMKVEGQESSKKMEDLLRTTLNLN